MASIELQRNWELIERFLLNAKASLLEHPDANSQNVNILVCEFDDYLGHNEFELALNAIAEAGRLVSPRGRFWHSLLQAAREMALHDKALEFQYLFVEAASNSLSQQVKRT